MADHVFPGCDGAFRLAGEGNIHDALACYGRALVSNPENDDVLNNKATALISPGQYEDPLTCQTLRPRSIPAGPESGPSQEPRSGNISAQVKPS
jgi:hypothetical protein